MTTRWQRVLCALGWHCWQETGFLHWWRCIHCGDEDDISI